MPRKLSPFCLITGRRKVAMARTWERIKQLEDKGKEEGGKRLREGKCFIEQ